MPLRREPKLFESLLRGEWRLAPEARRGRRGGVVSHRSIRHPTHWSICAQVAAATWEGRLRQWYGNPA